VRYNEASCAHCGSTQCLYPVTGVCEELWNSAFSSSDGLDLGSDASNFFDFSALSPSFAGPNSPEPPTPRLLSLSASHRPSPSASERGSTKFSQSARSDPIDTRAKNACSCLREALFVYEQVHYGHLNMPKLTFDHALSIARKANNVCVRYLNCQECNEDLNLLLCLNALQVTAACYKFLSTQTSKSDSPEITTFRCRIGTFEADTPIGSEVIKEILRDEVQGAIQALSTTHQLLQPSDYGNRKVRGLDTISRQYHQEMIDNIGAQLQEALNNSS